MIQNIKTGKCGDIDYTIKDGVLTFSGDGRMAEYSIVEDVPWHSVEIEKVAVEPDSCIFAPEHFDLYFAEQGALTDVSGLADIDTQYATSMRSLFMGCEKLSDISPLKDWITSDVRDMTCIFDGCASLRDLTPLDGWNTDAVVYMDYAFSGCGVETLDGLEHFDSGDNARELTGIFSGCRLLEDIYALSQWDVFSVDDMEYAFAGDVSLTNIDPLIEWKIAENTKLDGMFKDCSDLRDADALLDWELTDWGQVESMFEGTKVAEYGLPVYFPEGPEYDEEVL